MGQYIVLLPFLDIVDTLAPNIDIFIETWR